MSKDFADPFALPPALCTRRGSQSDRVDQRLERAGMESATARGPPSDTVCRPPISEHTRINLQRLPPPCHNHVKCRTDTLRQFSMVFPRTQRNGWLICAVTQMSEVDQLAAFSLFLKESAIDWYDALQEDVRGDMNSYWTNLSISFVRQHCTTRSEPNPYSPEFNVRQSAYGITSLQSRNWRVTCLVWTSRY